MYNLPPVTTPPPPSTRPQVLTFDELILSLPLSLVCLDSTFFKIDELHIILIYSVTCVTTVLLHSNGYKAPRRNTSWVSTKKYKKKKHMPSYPCACSILSEGGQVGVQVKTRVYTAIMVPVSDYDNNETITENSFRMSDLCLT